jgi:hypothetical protein
MTQLGWWSVPHRMGHHSAPSGADGVGGGMFSPGSAGYNRREAPADPWTPRRPKGANIPTRARSNGRAHALEVLDHGNLTVQSPVLCLSQLGAFVALAVRHHVLVL